MLPLVVVDSVETYHLARFGWPAGVVISDTRTPRRSYVVAPGAGVGANSWLKVSLVMRAVTKTDQPLRGFARITALTDGLASAAVEISAASRHTMRWRAVSLNTARSGRTSKASLRVALSNYVRLQAATPGRHTLAFRVRRFEGFPLEHVVIEPRSGLTVTRQPPQALRGSTRVSPPTPRVGSRFAIRLVIRNLGQRAATTVALQALAPDALRLEEPLPQVPPIGAQESTAVTLSATAYRPGKHLVQVLTDSNVGQDLQTVNLEVQDRRASGRPSAGRDDGGGTAGLAAAAGGCGILAAGFVMLWMRRRDRDVSRPT